VLIFVSHGAKARKNSYLEETKLSQISQLIVNNRGLVLYIHPQPDAAKLLLLHVSVPRSSTQWTFLFGSLNEVKL
jgi:hypothetical protein